MAAEGSEGDMKRVRGRGGKWGRERARRNGVV